VDVRDVAFVDEAKHLEEGRDGEFLVGIFRCFIDAEGQEVFRTPGRVGKVSG
jgi:hypothetical protein